MQNGMFNKTNVIYSQMEEEKKAPHRRNGTVEGKKIAIKDYSHILIKRKHVIKLEVASFPVDEYNFITLNLTQCGHRTVKILSSSK